MTLRPCPCESELTRLLRQGAWPEAAAPELRSHVAGCPSCTAQAELLTGLRQMRAEAVTQPHLPPAGQIWWRAQLRRRREAAERLHRPLLGAQLFALAVALFAALGLLAWLRTTSDALSGWPAELARAFNLAALVPTAFTHPGGLWLLLPALVMLAAVASAAVYFAIEKR